MNAAYGRLDGKVALVTGAGNGLGRAIGRLFVAEGATVVAVALRDQSLDQWRGEERAVPMQADLTDAADIDRIVDSSLDALGRIDVLCNVAGRNDLAYPLEETSDELWDAVTDLDLKAPFRICRRVIPAMVERGGGVVLNVGSYAATRGNHGPSYTAAKAGLVGLTLSLAVAYGGRGVRCNVINPGAIESTGIEAGSGGSYHAGGLKMFMDIVGKLPVDWICEPEGLAPVALFLCSDEAKHINGAVLAADGGMSAC